MDRVYMYCILPLCCAFLLTGCAAGPTVSQPGTAQGDPGQAAIATPAPVQPPAPAAVVPPAKRIETVIVDGLKLRAEPSGKSKVIAILRKDESVEVKSQHHSWVLIVIQAGTEGWVRGSGLTGCAEPGQKMRPTPSQPPPPPEKKPISGPAPTTGTPTVPPGTMGPGPEPGPGTGPVPSPGGNVGTPGVPQPQTSPPKPPGRVDDSAVTDPSLGKPKPDDSSGGSAKPKIDDSAVTNPALAKPRPDDVSRGTGKPRVDDSAVTDPALAKPKPDDAKASGQTP